MAHHTPTIPDRVGIPCPQSAVILNVVKDLHLFFRHSFDPMLGGNQLVRSRTNRDSNPSKRRSSTQSGQSSLRVSSPSVLLPRNRLLNVLAVLESDEAVAVVTRSETITFLPFVLKHALLQITGYSDIDGAASACHDVGAVRSVMHATIVSMGNGIGCDAKDKCRSFTAFSDCLFCQAFW